MTHEDDREIGINRILVALDASMHSFAALEAVVPLAAELRAELVGLFVEDLNLIHCAGMPNAREVGSYTAASRSVEVPHIEVELRALRSLAERALSQAAQHARVPSTFWIRRGRVATEILKASVETDLVCLGRVGWTSLGRPGVGSTVRAVMEQASGYVLVARRGTLFGGPIYVVFDGSEAATRALLLAIRIDRAVDSGLVVVTPRAAGRDPAELAGRAAAALEARRIDAGFRVVEVDGADSLALAISSGAAGLVVVPVGGAFSAHDLAVVAKGAPCPLIMVRTAARGQPEGTAVEDDPEAAPRAGTAA